MDFRVWIYMRWEVTLNRPLPHSLTYDRLATLMTTRKLADWIKRDIRSHLKTRKYMGEDTTCFDCGKTGHRTCVYYPALTFP